MKDCFVLYYNQDSVSVEEVYDVFKILEKASCMEGKTLIVLPDVVDLKNYTKNELKMLLDRYKQITEELLNE